MAVRQHVPTHELLGVVPLRYRACFLKPNKNQLWQGIVTTDLLKIYSACSYQPNVIEKPSAFVKKIGEVGRPSSFDAEILHHLFPSSPASFPSEMRYFHKDL